MHKDISLNMYVIGGIGALYKIENIGEILNGNH